MTEHDEMDELSEAHVRVILDDLESKTEDWVLVLAPLGDSVGWRCALLTAGTEETIAAASDVSWSKAVSLAVARARLVVEEAIEARAKALAEEDAEDR